jgi:hypothetical protein
MYVRFRDTAASERLRGHVRVKYKFYACMYIKAAESAMRTLVITGGQLQSYLFLLIRVDNQQSDNKYPAWQK